MKLRKILSALLSAVLLAGTVGSAGFRGYEVKAGSMVDVVGGGALFDFLLGLFGVSGVLGDNTPSGMPLYNEYVEYLSSGDTSMTYEEYEALSSGSVVTITQSLVDSVQAFLAEKVGSLTSGNIQTVYDDFVYDSFPSHSPQFESLRAYLQGISKGGFAIIWSIEKETFYVYKDLDLSYTYVLCSNPSKYSSNTLAYLSSFFYDSFGAPTSSNPPFSYECSYEYNKWNFSTGRIRSISVSGPGGSIVSSMVYANFPLIITEAEISTVKDLFYQDVISGASVIPEKSASVVSFGKYSTDTVNRLIGKTVTGSTISSANKAVADAVAGNTITDAETGAVSYTDEIAQAVADAVAKALADSGVIDKPVTGEGEGEGEGEEGEKPLPVVPDILELLKGIKDSISQGFQNVGEWIMDIPQSLGDFFTSLWEWFQRIWEAICALPGQIAEAFRSMMGGGAPPGEGEGEGGDSETPGFLAELSTLFPFCIPFDLIRLFKVMQSTAKAPYWEVPLDVPSIDFHYVFVIDFAQFEALARIFRVCETMGFVCGLILITRKLIRG